VRAFRKIHLDQLSLLAKQGEEEDGSMGMTGEWQVVKLHLNLSWFRQSAQAATGTYRLPENCSR
jgi:hypothetical protein